MKPSDVFTPGKLPLKPQNVYAKRATAEGQLKKADERAFVPLVYGEYGVGKTSTVRKYIQDNHPASPLVNIESVADKSFQDVVAAILEKIGYQITTQTQKGGGSAQGKGFSLEVTVPVSQNAAVKVGGKADFSNSSTETESRTFAVTSPTDSKVLALCEDRSIQLLIDELHKADDEFRTSLANFIKAFGNKSCERFRIYLLGTTADPIILIKKDEGINRLLQEIRLPALQNSEANYIVVEGMNRLAIKVSNEIVESIVSMSVGSPSILQHICLEAADRAFMHTPRTLEQADIRAALHDYVANHASRLNDVYMKAIETTGQKQYRKQIMRAMAECADEYVTMEQIRSGVSKNLGKNIRSTALSGPLRDLKSDHYGRVLRDVEGAQEGERVHNLSAFSNPGMRAFVRMRHQAEARGFWMEEEEFPTSN